MSTLNVVDPERDAGFFIDCESFAKDSGIAKAGRLPSYQAIRRVYPHIVVQGSSAGFQRLFVTHRWDSISHPDPTGWQLRVLRRYCKYLARGSGKSSGKWCFWYDYMSLPQKPRRTARDKELFKRGLHQVQRLASECRNVFLVSRDGRPKTESFDCALKRGWILVEQFLARASQLNRTVIFEGDWVDLISGPGTWSGVVPDLRHLVPAESPSLILEWFNARKVQCTNGSDLSLLAALLHDHLGRIDYSRPPPGLRFNRAKTVAPTEMAKYQVAAGGAVSSLFPNVFFEGLKYQSRPGYRRKPYSFTPVIRPKLPVPGVWHFYSEKQFRQFRVDPGTQRSPMYPGILFDVCPAKGRRGRLVRINVGSLSSGNDFQASMCRQRASGDEARELAVVVEVRGNEHGDHARQAPAPAPP